MGIDEARKNVQVELTTSVNNSHMIIIKYLLNSLNCTVFDL